jgi:hypothetical protein
VHFGFATLAGNRLHEGSAIRPYRMAQRFIGIEKGTKTKRKNGKRSEKLTDHPRVIDNRLLSKRLTGEMLADNYRKVTTGIS